MRNFSPAPGRAALGTPRCFPYRDAINGIDYLETWNFKHIANATLRSRIESVCREAGYEPPLICTPEELLGA